MQQHFGHSIFLSFRTLFSKILLELFFEELFFQLQAQQYCCKNEMKHLHSQSSNTPETLVFPFTHSTPNQNMRSLKFLTPFCLFFCQNATIEAKFQKNIKMPAPLINKGLHTISTGGLSGVRFFFTRSARTLLDSLSSIQKVELSSDFFGAPGGVRIPNLWFRRPTLYPVELKVHILFFSTFCQPARGARLS